MSTPTGPVKIKVIIGSTRQGRFSEKPAQWIFDEAKKLQGVEVELLDLREFQLPFLEDPMPPSMAKGQYSSEAVTKWAEKIHDGDAFIIVSPEYNHGYSAVLKNALDVISPEWKRKPVGFVGYGSAMGARAIEQLRQVAVELQMAPIRHAVHIPVDIFMAHMMGTGPTGPEMFEPIRKNPMGDAVEKFFDDLLWWAKALKTARAESE